MAKKRKKKGTNSEERVKFLTKVGQINSKKLKNNATKWELILKKYLTELGYKFKTQVPLICNKHHLYIVDFLLTDFNIFLEADGKQHFTKENLKKDKRRTKCLQKEGYEPLRLTNKQIEIYSKEAIDQIIKTKIQLLKSANN